MYSNETNAILRKMCDYKYVMNADEVDITVLHSLVDNKFIKPCTKGFVIADAGIAYIEAIKASEQEAKKNNFHQWFNTVIAFVALIVAIVTLFR